jgi:hypothetical protein
MQCHSLVSCWFEQLQWIAMPIGLLLFHHDSHSVCCWILLSACSHAAVSMCIDVELPHRIDYQYALSCWLLLHQHKCYTRDVLQRNVLSCWFDQCNILPCRFDLSQ